MRILDTGQMLTLDGSFLKTRITRDTLVTSIVSEWDLRQVVDLIGNEMQTEAGLLFVDGHGLYLQVDTQEYARLQAHIEINEPGEARPPNPSRIDRMMTHEEILSICKARSTRLLARVFVPIISIAVFWHYLYGVLVPHGTGVSDDVVASWMPEIYIGCAILLSGLVGAKLMKPEIFLTRAEFELLERMGPIEQS